LSRREANASTCGKPRKQLHSPLAQDIFDCRLMATVFIFSTE
jgi:hypothetical protein